MSATDIAHALGNARREDRGWRCRCPLHQDRGLVLRDHPFRALIELIGAATASAKTEELAYRNKQRRELKMGANSAITVTKLVPPAVETNPWLEVANEAGSELGRILKFVKGRYECGDDEVPLGTEFVAHLDQLARGMAKFAGDQVADRRIGKVADGYKPPERAELDDNDEAQWEKDPTGKPRDPWVAQWYLALTRIDTGELLTFVTGSKGGMSAIGALCRVYGRKSRDGLLPVVALRVRSYKHRLYGRIETPDLEIVGWDGALAPTVVQSDSLDDQIPF